MSRATVNDKFNFELIEGKIDLDMIRSANGQIHVVKDHISYRAEVLNTDPETKSFLIRINGKKYHVKLQDKYDKLLKELGIENKDSQKLKEVKAPMPGLVIEVRVKEGDQVEKGDPLLVLQAMKMENVLNSTGKGVVKSVHVNKNDAVEKNQKLISFS